MSSKFDKVISCEEFLSNTLPWFSAIFLMMCECSVVLIVFQLGKYVIGIDTGVLFLIFIENTHLHSFMILMCEFECQMPK